MVQSSSRQPWNVVEIESALALEASQLNCGLNELENAWLELRLANWAKLLRMAARLGPSAPAPKLKEPSFSERKYRLQILAQRDVVWACRQVVNDGPEALRSRLKWERDYVGEAILYESELRDYLRAKNKAIGWRLVWLDEFYLGPDPAPVAQWGRSSQPPEGEAYEEARTERRHIYCVVSPGAPPQDPELAPDAMRKAYECWMAQNARKWLPVVMAKYAAIKPRAFDAQRAKMVNELTAVLPRAIAVLTLHSDRLLDLDDLRSRARDLGEHRPKSHRLWSDEVFGEAWRLVCADIFEVLCSDYVSQLIRGEKWPRQHAA